jgi:sulfatase maturation enzyme AslB (radical SAM superfamily)
MSPSEFLKSDYLADLRTKFLNEEFDETCISCKKQEDAGLQSIRQHMIKDYGETVTPVLDYMELRASNLCNFQCKMCNGDNSSLISGKVITISDSDWNEILKISENLKFLTLTGGEPMLIKHYYQLLDYLIEKNKTDMELRIYTNASVYNPIFVEKMLKFDTMLNLSIDGINNTAEDQRLGTDWNVVKENIYKFLKLPVKIKFHSTFTTISIKDIYSLAKFFVEVADINSECRFAAHTANGPRHLSIHNINKLNFSKQDIISTQKSLDSALDILIDNRFDQLRQQLISYKAILESKSYN